MVSLVYEGSADLRVPATESISSMKIIAGAFCLAFLKSSLTLLAPGNRHTLNFVIFIPIPTNNSSNSEPAL